jgi:hypothetical protein
LDGRVFKEIFEKDSVLEKKVVTRTKAEEEKEKVKRRIRELKTLKKL